MSNVLPIGVARATFTVRVLFDVDAGVWVGWCDDLALSTEADTYELLVERVWAIAPEMALENGLNIPEAHLRLVFQHETPDLAVAL